MKAARRKKSVLRPRNPVAASPLLAKAGAHARRDKKASRAKQVAGLRRRLLDQ